MLPAVWHRSASTLHGNSDVSLWTVFFLLVPRSLLHDILRYCPERFLSFERAKMLRKHLLHSIRRRAAGFFFHSVGRSVVVHVDCCRVYLVGLHGCDDAPMVFVPSFVRHMQLLMSTACSGATRCALNDWRSIQPAAAFDTHLRIYVFGSLINRSHTTRRPLAGAHGLIFPRLLETISRWTVAVTIMRRKREKKNVKKSIHRTSASAEIFVFYSRRPTTPLPPMHRVPSLWPRPFFFLCEPK